MKWFKKVLIVVIIIIILAIVGISILATTEWGQEAGRESYQKHQQLDREAQENQ